MAIFLIRHGESIYNKKGIIQGTSDSKLSKNGILQAEKVANKMKNKEIKIIYSSPLKKAKTVARYIHDKNKNSILKLEKSLTDISYGSIQGKKSTEELEKLRVSDENVKNGAEPWPIFDKRIHLAFENLLEKYDNESIVIVSHNPVLRNIVKFLENKFSKKIYVSGGFHNCSITSFDFDEKGNLQILLYNNIDHLI